MIRIIIIKYIIIFILKKSNATPNNHINWKKVIYPKLFEDTANKTTKNKKRQNFRLIVEKYTLSEDNVLYLKILNKDNKIQLFKVPYEYEKLSLFKRFHNDNNHISYKRLYKEIKEAKYNWKTLCKYCLNYIKECPFCIREKAGINIKPNPKPIITKGPCERYVVDNWKMHNELATLRGYTFILDIIDHFSKFMMSYPLITNDANNALLSIKEFCLLKGMPEILQSDNGSEFKNNLIKEFCEKYKIKQIFSSPYHPSTNGAVEVCHKKIRKNVIIYYSENPINFNLKNVILEIVHNHNNNIHTVTDYRPIDLFNNTDLDIYNKVVENIKKRVKINEDNYKKNKC